MTIEYPHAKLQALFFSNPHGMRWRGRHRHAGLGWDEWALGSTYAPNWFIHYEYEVEPIPESKTHFTVRREVPRPLKVLPTFGQTYWVIILDASLHTSFYVCRDDPIDRYVFAQGLAFATEADAQANLDAMLAREEE